MLYGAGIISLSPSRPFVSFSLSVVRSFVMDLDVRFPSGSDEYNIDSEDDLGEDGQSGPCSMF